MTMLISYKQEIVCLIKQSIHHLSSYSKYLPASSEDLLLPGPVTLLTQIIYTQCLSAYCMKNGLSVASHTQALKRQSKLKPALAT